MQYKMLDFVSGIKDPRRGQGQRHKLEHIIVIVVMAIISGHQGLKGFARFAANNEEELHALFHFKYGVPRFNTIRSVLNGLDEQLLAKQFAKWIKSYHSDLADDFVALDGKAVRSTTKGGNTDLQNFISVVSAFGHHSQLVYAMSSYENNKTNEGQALRAVVEQLGLSELIFTMDALHAQKKPSI